MSWIQTYTGKLFWPLAPRPEDVNVFDIAHGLSLQCRFNGQCKSFYSVAQHSILVSEHVRPALALRGLLHDAAEAYLPDICGPIKSEFPGFNELERRMLEAIGIGLGVVDLEKHSDEIKLADRRAVITEIQHLLYRPRCHNMKAAPHPFTDVERIEPLTPEIAEQRFLAAYRMLKHKIDGDMRRCAFRGPCVGELDVSDDSAGTAFLHVFQCLRDRFRPVTYSDCMQCPQRQSP